MAVTTLQAGMRDLTAGFERRAKRKQAKQAAQQRQEGLAKLSEVLAKSTEGQTTAGQFAATGLSEDLTSPKEALGLLKGMNRTDLLFKIYNKSLTEKDPANKRMLQHIVNQMGDKMAQINEQEAWSRARGQARGTLQTKKEFGVLTRPRSAGGGGRAGAKTAGDGGAGDVDPDTGKYNVNVDLSYLRNDMMGFVSNHPYYRNTTNRLSSALNIDASVAKQQAFRQDFFNETKNSLEKNYPTLSSVIIEELADDATDQQMVHGLKAFMDKSKAGGQIQTVPYVKKINLDREAMVVYGDQKRVRTQKKKRGKGRDLFLVPTSKNTAENVNIIQNTEVTKKVEDSYYE